MLVVNKLKIINFKRFSEVKEFNFAKYNGIYGDNEFGKSTILEAVIYGLTGKDINGENTNIERLFNRQAVEEFMRIPEQLQKQFEEWAEGKSENKAKLLNDFRQQYDLYAEIPEICIDKSYLFI